ncbi:MAG: hypothetical protein HUJ16_08860 [Kangiella sp.]|nr:hypothetical protein [Kangiella sp.]
MFVYEVISGITILLFSFSVLANLNIGRGLSDLLFGSCILCAVGTLAFWLFAIIEWPPSLREIIRPIWVIWIPVLAGTIIGYNARSKSK